MREKIVSKRKKLAPQRPARLRNRYVRDAKLSEYKFLKLLSGFSDLVHPRRLSAQTWISEKTVKKFYHAFRVKIKEAIRKNHQLFGGAGFILYRRGYLTKRGERLIETIYRSKAFAFLVLSQTPRFNRHDHDLSLFAWELVVRYTCLSSRRSKIEDMYDERYHIVSKALDRMEEISLSITQKDKPTQEEIRFVNSHIEISKKFDYLDELRELSSFLDSANPSSDVSYRVFEELRHYILKHPISFRHSSGAESL